MRKFKRRVRNHYSYTARRVAVRADRPWYYWLIAGLLCVALGFGLAYAMARNSDYEAKVQDENLKAKEDLFFYKNMTGK